MVVVLVFVDVLAFLIWMLMAPSSVRDIIQWSVPKEMRTPKESPTQFATIAIFFVGIGLFYEIGQTWPTKKPMHLAPFAFWSGVASAVLLLATGAFACLRPIQWMRLFNPHLRGIPAGSFDSGAKQHFSFIAKGFGVVFLLASTYVIHQIAVSN